jgi:hypothetical protein
MCAQWPYWWDQRPDNRKHYLDGWLPGDYLHRAFPVISRHGCALRDDRSDIAFRALLCQPAIFCGHHYDLSDGLDVLEELATDVQRYGPYQWMSLQRIAATNFQWQRLGPAMRIRLFSREVLVDVPEDVTELQIEMPSTYDPSAGDIVLYQLLDAPPADAHDVRMAHLGQPLSVSKAGTYRLRLHGRSRSPDGRLRWSAPRMSARAAVEARDRLEALTRQGWRRQ